MGGIEVGQVTYERETETLTADLGIPSERRAFNERLVRMIGEKWQVSGRKEDGFKVEVTLTRVVEVQS